jgi:rhomboid family GlyGly-CTERM serine protease
LSSPGLAIDSPRVPAAFNARSRAWWLVALALAAGSLLIALADPNRFDWQPSLALTQPWRWWTAAWVHWSGGHRWANLLGTLLVATLGWRAHCDRADALAWFGAWPLTQLGLSMQPGLLHYGGLSGVLHAGVVIAAMGLGQREHGLRRAVGFAILAGVVLKVLFERPWLEPLRLSPGWDIAIAPAAHLSGSLAGALCALAAAVWRRTLQPKLRIR